MNNSSPSPNAVECLVQQQEAPGSKSRAVCFGVSAKQNLRLLFALSYWRDKMNRGHMARQRRAASNQATGGKPAE